MKKKSQCYHIAMLRCIRVDATHSLRLCREQEIPTIAPTRGKAGRRVGWGEMWEGCTGVKSVNVKWDWWQHTAYFQPLWTLVIQYKSGLKATRLTFFFLKSIVSLKGRIGVKCCIYSFNLIKSKIKIKSLTFLSIEKKFK